MPNKKNNDDYIDINSHSDNPKRRPPRQSIESSSVPQSVNHDAEYGDNFNDDDVSYRQSRHRSQSEPRPTPERPKKGRGGKIFKAIVIILLILFLLLGGYFLLVITRINYSDEHPDHNSVISEVGELKSRNGVQNIMLFGEDNHKEGEHGRSDSMILLSLDKNHHTLKQTSFLRDMYLTIPGYGEDKLNAAYAYGGAKLAVETIEYNFRIQIDHYVIIDFSTYTAIVDALGGIDLQLTEDEVKYINWQSYRNKQTDNENELDVNSYTFTEDKDGNETATVHLNGRQALWYARNRDSAGSDFDRTSRQRIVVDTIFTKLKSGNPLGLLCAVYDAAPLITTDMSKLDITQMGLGMFSYLRYDRKQYSVPRSDNFYNDWANNAQVLMISDMDYEREKLYNFVFSSENDE